MVTSHDGTSFVPSNERPVPPGEQWLIDRIAEAFLATGEWPKLTVLKRDAARLEVELPQVFYGVPATDFLWRPESDDTVVLSITGLARSSSGQAFVEQFLRVVLLCRDIYLGEGEGPPKITSEEIRSQLGFDDETIARIQTMIRFEYYLTGSGGSRSPSDWYYEISDTVQRFRGVMSAEEFFALRAEIVRPVQIWASDPLSGEIQSDEPDIPNQDGQVIFDAAVELPSPQENFGPVPDPRNVFVVHGRDLATRDAMCEFLKVLGLHPLNWDEMVQANGEGTPFTGRVIEYGFSIAQAFVVLMTPEDEARLHADLHDDDEPEHERELTCQPRPNVIFEAGMAFGVHADRTIMVHLGSLRPISDLAGRNVVHLGPTKAPLHALAVRLKAARCPVDISAADAFDPTRFSGLASLTRRARSPDGVARGRILPREQRLPQPRLSVALHERGRGDRLLEIANRGQVTLHEVEWELSEPAPNWALLTSVLPAYPVPALEPQQHLRIPVAISMGGPVYVDLRVQAKTETGEPYETVEHLSVYG